LAINAKTITGKNELTWGGGGVERCDDIQNEKKRLKGGATVVGGARIPREKGGT